VKGKDALSLKGDIPSTGFGYYGESTGKQGQSRVPVVMSAPRPFTAARLNLLSVKAR
jgi:hypothetical protein